MKLPNGLIEFMKKNQDKIMARFSKNPRPSTLYNVIYNLMPKKPGPI